VACCRQKRRCLRGVRRAGKITSEALAWFKSFGEDII